LSVAAEDMSILRPKERALAQQNMREGERVRFCLVGVQGQSLVALDDRLLIVKTGFMSGATLGGRATSFGYADISAIQVNTGMATGTLEVHSPGLGATKGSDYWSMNKNEDPYKLPNTIPIAKASLAQYQPYLDQLRSLIDRAKRPSAPSSSTDIAGQLTQLKTLLDAGALTPGEFDAAKTRVFGGATLADSGSTQPEGSVSDGETIQRPPSSQEDPHAQALARTQEWIGFLKTLPRDQRKLVKSQWRSAVKDYRAQPGATDYPGAHLDPFDYVPYDLLPPEKRAGRSAR
jgi:hypothetical protein